MPPLRTLFLPAAILFACFPSALGAQAEPVPGIDATRLPLGLDSLAMYVIRNGDTIRTGTVWDELRVDGEGASSRLVRVYRSSDRARGIRLDTIIDAFPSLAPIRSSSRGTVAAEQLSYSSGAITGWYRRAGGDSVALNVPLRSPVYGGASFDLVLRAAPLREGWRGEVPAFVGAGGAVWKLTAQVSGVDNVAGEDCWRIDADYAGSAVTFWVGQTSRRLCRQLIEVAPGMELLFVPLPGPSAAPGRAA